MSTEITIPKLGLTMESGTLTHWLVAKGEEVSRGQTIFSLETDKISFEVEAEEAGFVDPIIEEGQELPVGAIVGYIHENAEAARLAERDPVRLSKAKVPDTTSVLSPTASIQNCEIPKSPAATAGHERQRISPLARRIANSNGLELARIEGSGPNGTIRKKDVQAALAKRDAQSQLDAAADVPQAAPERRPMSPMRKVINQRMLNSLNGTAQMTGFTKVDMTEVIAWRETIVADAPHDSVRITYTDIVTKVAALALREVPDLNNYIDGDDIVFRQGVHMGIAVALDDGLIVPVIHDVDTLTLSEIAQRRKALVDKARSGSLRPDDLAGGTFTISNFGSYGGDFETPILNSQQSGLLGIGKIEEEPAVQNGQIVIRSKFMLSLTFDHGLIDGAVAGRFRRQIRDMLENPAFMLSRMR